MVAHVLNPSTQEAEAGGSLWSRGQVGLQNEFQDSQGYTEKQTLSLKNQRNYSSMLFIWAGH